MAEAAKSRRRIVLTEDASWDERIEFYLNNPKYLTLSGIARYIERSNERVRQITRNQYRVKSKGRVFLYKGAVFPSPVIFTLKNNLKRFWNKQEVDEWRAKSIDGFRLHYSITEDNIDEELPKLIEKHYSQQERLNSSRNRHDH